MIFLISCENKYIKLGMVLSGNVLMVDATIQENVLKTNPNGDAFEIEGHGILTGCDMLKRKVICICYLQN